VSSGKGVIVAHKISASELIDQVIRLQNTLPDMIDPQVHSEMQREIDEIMSQLIELAWEYTSRFENANTPDGSIMWLNRKGTEPGAAAS